MPNDPLDLWDHDDEPYTDDSYDLPSTVPDFAPERFGAPLEPRSETAEEQLFERVCSAMRDGDGRWVLPYAIGLTWSLLDPGEPGEEGSWGEVPTVYGIRMLTVHAVRVTEPGEEWQGPRTELRRESTWLMRRHLQPLEDAKARVYGGDSRVILEPPIGASELAPLQAIDVTVIHVPRGGRPAGDEWAYWSITRLLRARDLSRPLVLSMAARPVGFPG